MNTKLKRVVGVPVTPAEAMTDYLVDHINAIMISCGIKTLDIQKYTSGFGNRLHVTMTPFEDAPQEIVTQGLVVKDALAQIMAIVNLARQSVDNFTKEEMDNIHALWKKSVAASKAPRQMPQLSQTSDAQQEPQEPQEQEDGIPLDLAAVTPEEPQEPQEQQDSQEHKKTAKTRKRKSKK